MRARWMTIAGMVLLTFCAAFALGLSRGTPRLGLELVRVEVARPASQDQAQPQAQVTVRLRNHSLQCVFFLDHQTMQTRVAHQWSAPQRLAQLACTSLPPVTASDEFTLVVPPRTEAVRLSLESRFGASRYCRAYGF